MKCWVVCTECDHPVPGSDLRRLRDVLGVFFSANAAKDYAKTHNAGLGPAAGPAVVYAQVDCGGESEILRAMGDYLARCHAVVEFGPFLSVPGWDLANADAKAKRFCASVRQASWVLTNTSGRDPIPLDAGDLAALLRHVAGIIENQ